MDDLKPNEVLTAMLAAGTAKARLPLRDGAGAMTAGRISGLQA